MTDMDFDHWGAILKSCRKLAVRLIWIFAICSSMQLAAAGDTSMEQGRAAGLALLWSGRDAFQGLNSYRCRFADHESSQSDWTVAYSGSKYRIEHQQAGQVVSLRVFDGETYAILGMKEMYLQRGTRAPSRVPMTQSPFDMCYQIRDVGLDHYHSQGFLEKQAATVVGSQTAEFKGHACLDLKSVSARQWTSHLWISKEFSGFPLAMEEHNSSGALIARQEVLDHEVFEVDGQKLLFPIHIHFHRPVPLSLIPEAFRKAAEASADRDILIDRQSIEINPEIPLSEFQIDPAQAKSIKNTDTGEVLFENGDVLASDFKLIPAQKQPDTPVSPSSSPPLLPVVAARSGKSWLILFNVLLVLFVAGYLGYRQWRS